MPNLPGIHVFHAHYNIASVIHESAIEGYDVRRIAFVHDSELSNDAFTNFFLGFNMDDL